MTDRLAIVILLLAVVLMLMLFRYRVVVSPSGVSVRRTLAGVVPLAPSDSLAWSEISEVHSQGGIVFSSGGVDLRISISDELQRAWIGGVLNEFLGRTSLDRVS